MKRDQLASKMRLVVALVREGRVHDGIELQRGLVAGLLSAPRRHGSDAEDGQLAMSLVLAQDALVQDCPLHICGLRVSQCLRRQRLGDLAPRDPDRPVELARHDKKRGRMLEEGACVTAWCPVGAALRAAHDPKKAKA